MEKEKEASESQVERAVSAMSLAGLIAGFRDYAHTWRRVLSYRGRLAEIASPAEPPICFQSSIVFFLYGVLVSFVLYLPLIKIHGLELTKVHYFVQFLYFQVIYVFLIHISAKVFRGKGSLKDTAAVYCTWIGIAAPSVLLLNYPLFVYMPVTDFVDQSLLATSSPPQWVWIWVATAFLFSIVAFFFLVLKWTATVHKLKTRWLLLGFLIVYFPLMGLHNHFIAPFVSQALAVTSEFLINLL